MAPTIYIKEDPVLKSQLKKKRDRAFFGFITFVGFISIVFSVWPIISWQLITSPKLNNKVKDSPIPKGEVLSNAQVLAQNIQVVKDSDGFSYFVPTENLDAQDLSRPKEFTISIPKLKIKEAITKVDTLNFYNNLALFPGSAIPGEVGNSFITGHSVLPQFNDPENYRAIFTKLSDLEVGDDVVVNLDGKTFHYVVQYSKIVDPHDISVLNPISQNGRNLTLMSCVPPGTSTKRLIVITSLI